MQGVSRPERDLSLAQLTRKSKRGTAHFLKQQRRRRRRRLWLEPLEDRRLLATFVVNSVLDLPDSLAVPEMCDTELDPFANPPVPASGICTLRAAVMSSNSN